jgi:hypothetical protein
VLELRHRRQRGVFEATHRGGSGDPQTEGDGECFVVIEKEGRKFASSAESVPTTWPCDSLDGVAKVA